MVKTGLVENPHPHHFYIREERTWTRYFVSGSDCHDGIPPASARVSFVPDFSDPRGPRGRDVRVIQEPLPELRRQCRDCRQAFVLTGAQLVWFRVKGLKLPARCEECRRARREVRR